MTDKKSNSSSPEINVEERSINQGKSRYKISITDKIMQKTKRIDLNQHQIEISHLYQAIRYLEHQKIILERYSSKSSLTEQIISNANKMALHDNAIEKLKDIIKSDNSAMSLLIDSVNKRGNCTDAIIIDAFANNINNENNRSEQDLKTIAVPSQDGTPLNPNFRFDNESSSSLDFTSKDKGSRSAVTNFMDIQQIEDFLKDSSEKKIIQLETIEHNQDIDSEIINKKITRFLRKQYKILEKSEKNYKKIYLKVEGLVNRIENYLNDKMQILSETEKNIINLSLIRQDEILQENLSIYRNTAEYVKDNIEKFNPFHEEEEAICKREEFYRSKRKLYKDFFKIIKSVYNLEESIYPTLKELQTNYLNNNTPNKRMLDLEDIFKKKITNMSNSIEIKSSSVFENSRLQVYKVIDILTDIEKNTISISKIKANLDLRKNIYEKQVKNYIIQELNKIIKK